MACNNTTPWTLGCRDNLGGIQLAYLRNFSAGTTYTYDATGIITGTSANALASSWYTIEQVQETGGFNAGDGQHSVTNGTNFYQVTVDLAFHKYQASVRNIVYTLAQTETEVIILDQNGKYFLAGEQNGCNLVSSDSNVGKAFGDMNGSVIQLLANEPWQAREVDSTFISTLTIV